MTEPFMTTASGRKFHFLEPRIEEVDIGDIAYHLSNICRFNGACSSPYSVAEHCLRVASILPPELQLAGLLHDGTEAYIGDMTRPLKQVNPKFKEIEDRIAAVINTKWNININHPEIKKADNILIATEARDLMPNMDGWEELPEPLVGKITPLSSGTAKMFFLLRFKEYAQIDF